MTILVSPQKNVSSCRLPVQEDQRVEFKVSAFRAPNGSRHRQVETIAREIAAFMNADGGDLYLGVKDNGVVVGIQKDLDALSSGSDETIVRGPGLDDTAWHEENKIANEDTYARKINQIVQGYLGQSACQWLGDVDFQRTDDDFVYARVPVMRASKGEVVLFQVDRWSDLMVRTQGRMQCFKDRERDAFVAHRARESALEGSIAKDHEILERIAKIEERLKQGTNCSIAFVAPTTGEEQVEATHGPAQGNALEIDSLNIALLPRDLPPCVSQRNLESEYDATTSVTSVMDAFDRKINGEFQYQRMFLKSRTLSKMLIPYRYVRVEDRNESGLRRIGEGECFLDDCALIIERPLKRKEYCPSKGISFSALKKGVLGEIGSRVDDWFEQGVFTHCSYDTPCEFSFSNPISFYAHTTESFSRTVDPNVYNVIGLRFTKRKSYFRPEHLSDLDCINFKRRNQAAQFSLKSSQKTSCHTSGLALERSYDSTTSVTRVMDEFEARTDGNLKYDRLILSHLGKGPEILPYVYEQNASKVDENDCHPWHYRRVNNIEYKLTDIQLVVERMEDDEQSTISWTGISFTDLKKGCLNSVEDEVLVSLASMELQDMEDGMSQLILAQPIVFRANTSDSFFKYGSRRPNVYKIVAIRFRKQDLYLCPDELSEEDYRDFASKNLLERLRLFLAAVSGNRPAGAQDASEAAGT